MDSIQVSNAFPLAPSRHGRHAAAWYMTTGFQAGPEAGESLSGGTAYRHMASREILSSSTYTHQCLNED